MLIEERRIPPAQCRGQIKINRRLRPSHRQGQMVA
jgi:hypothetical protein